MRRCEVCTNEFKVTRPNKIYCTDACKKKVWKERDAIRSKIIKSVRIDMKCERCGTIFNAMACKVRSPSWVQNCTRCKLGLTYLNNPGLRRGRPVKLEKPINGLIEKPFILPCGTCEWAKVTSRTETGYLCSRSALVCNPWYAARLFEPIQEAT